MTGVLQPSLSPLTSGREQVYLRLRLDPNTVAMVEMGYAKEVLTVAAQRIAPMPNVPACVLGLLNQRSHVYWVVDLAAMLGLKPLDPKAQSYVVAILQADSLPLGFAVSEVMGVLRLSSETLQEPWKGGKDSLSQYAQGHVTLSEREILTVLNAKALLRSPLWSSELTQ